MNQKKDISRWLLVLLSLVILIVVVGAITRLTQSGLSIVEWNVITGILPPLNEEQWNIEFDKYKESPEYKIVNQGMKLSDFKTIYFWEYLHRLLARLLGLISVIPLIYFIIKKKINFNETKELLAIPLLVGVQGLIGWMMVKSGLDLKTYNSIGVSHYMLALHLSLALVTYSIILWNYLKINNKTLVNSYVYNMNYGFFVFSMIFVQIILGALLSGLDAGLITNNFPDINGEFYPSKALVDLSNPYFVHFVHRWLPIIMMLIGFLIFNKIKANLNQTQKSLFGILVIIFIIQMLLGILTVLTSINILMAIMHQLNAIIMLTVALIISFSFNSK